MSPFLVLVRKQLAEARWFLGLSAAALFALGWLMVLLILTFSTFRPRPDDPDAQIMAEANRIRMSQGMRVLGGESVDGSVGSMEVALWCHPLFVMPILIAWPITRGANPVAGEVERGRLDLILSRPVTRGTYLASHVVVAVLGMALMAAAMVAGNAVGNRFHRVADPPALWPLVRAGSVVVAFGVALFGYTLAFSAIDRVNWRPLIVGAALPFVSGILGGVAQFFRTSREPWAEPYKKLNRASIFYLFEPVEALVSGRQLGFHAGVLLGIGGAGIAAAYVAFRARDLPAAS